MSECPYCSKEVDNVEAHRKAEHSAVDEYYVKDKETTGEGDFWQNSNNFEVDDEEYEKTGRVVAKQPTDKRAHETTIDKCLKCGRSSDNHSNPNTDYRGLRGDAPPTDHYYYAADDGVESYATEGGYCNKCGTYSYANSMKAHMQDKHPEVPRSQWKTLEYMGSDVHGDDRYVGDDVADKFSQNRPELEKAMGWGKKDDGWSSESTATELDHYEQKQHQSKREWDEDLDDIKKNFQFKESWDFKSFNDKVESFEALGFTQGDAVNLASLNWYDLSTEVQQALEVEDDTKEGKRNDGVAQFDRLGFTPKTEISDLDDIDYNVINESFIRTPHHECEYCNSTFTSNESLAIHYNDIHAVNQFNLDGYESSKLGEAELNLPMNCPECNAYIADESTLEAHEQKTGHNIISPNEVHFWGEAEYDVKCGCDGTKPNCKYCHGTGKLGFSDKPSNESLKKKINEVRTIWRCWDCKLEFNSFEEGDKHADEYNHSVGTAQRFGESKKECPNCLHGWRRDVGEDSHDEECSTCDGTGFVGESKATEDHWEKIEKEEGKMDGRQRLDWIDRRLKQLHDQGEKDKVKEYDATETVSYAEEFNHCTQCTRKFGDDEQDKYIQHIKDTGHDEGFLKLIGKEFSSWASSYYWPSERGHGFECYCKCKICGADVDSCDGDRELIDHYNEHKNSGHIPSFESFEEQEHPRADDGKFTSKGSGSSGTPENKHANTSTKDLIKQIKGGSDDWNTWYRNEKNNDLYAEIERRNREIPVPQKPEGVGQTIFRDDPDAVSKMEAKVKYLEDMQNYWKQITKFPVRDYHTRNQLGDAKFYELSNLSANLRDARQKLEGIKAQQARGTDLVRKPTFKDGKKRFYYSEEPREGGESLTDIYDDIIKIGEGRYDGKGNYGSGYVCPECDADFTNDNEFVGHMSENHNWDLHKSWTAVGMQDKKRSGEAWDIKHGDKVTIVDQRGQTQTGKAVMRSSAGGWIINIGGAHGTPKLASDDNIVAVESDAHEFKYGDDSCANCGYKFKNRHEECPNCTGKSKESFAAEVEWMCLDCEKKLTETPREHQDRTGHHSISKYKAGRDDEFITEKGMYGYGSATGRMSPRDAWNQSGGGALSFTNPIFEEFASMSWDQLPQDIQELWKADLEYMPSGEAYNTTMEQMWKHASQSQRASLLTSLGYNTDWAKLDSIEEIGQRGGGSVRRDLEKLWDTLQSRTKDNVNVLFESANEHWYNDWYFETEWDGMDVEERKGHLEWVKANPSHATKSWTQLPQDVKTRLGKTETQGEALSQEFKPQNQGKKIKLNDGSTATIQSVGIFSDDVVTTDGKMVKAGDYEIIGEGKKINDDDIEEGSWWDGRGGGDSAADEADVETGWVEPYYKDGWNGNDYSQYKKCGMCGKEFNTRQELEDHVHSLGPHNRSTVKEGFQQGLYGYVDAKCKTCGLEFASISDMDDHYREFSDHESNINDLDSTIPNSD